MGKLKRDFCMPLTKPGYGVMSDNGNQCRQGASFGSVLVASCSVVNDGSWSLEGE